MRTGLRNLHWYDIPLLSFAVVIVYPDRTLDWLGETTGWAFKRWHILLVETAAISLLIVTMLFLMPVYPRLEWWYPLLSIGMLAIMRAALWLISDLFGFGD